MCIFVGGRDTRQSQPSSDFLQGVSASVGLPFNCSLPKQLCAAPAAFQPGGFVSASPLSCLLSFYLFFSSLYLLGLTLKSLCSGFVYTSPLCLNFGPLCFCLYSFLCYFSAENHLLLFSPSVQSIIFLHPLSASLAAVISNWCFSASAFILCLFFSPPSSHPCLSFPVSYLPYSVSVGRDGC